MLCSANDKTQDSENVKSVRKSSYVTSIAFVNGRKVFTEFKCHSRYSHRFSLFSTQMFNLSQFCFLSFEFSRFSLMIFCFWQYDEHQTIQITSPITFTYKLSFLKQAKSFEIEMCSRCLMSQSQNDFIVYLRLAKSRI